MARLKITKEARLSVQEFIRANAILDKEVVKDIIRPYQLFDPAAAKEKELGELARRLIANIKDTRGVRDVYALNDKARPGLFVNVTATSDVETLDQVDEQLAMKYIGLDNSRKKIAVARHRILGPLCIRFEDFL